MPRKPKPQPQIQICNLLRMCGPKTRAVGASWAGRVLPGVCGKVVPTAGYFGAVMFAFPLVKACLCVGCAAVLVLLWLVLVSSRAWWLVLAAGASWSWLVRGRGGGWCWRLVCSRACV